MDDPLLIGDGDRVEDLASPPVIIASANVGVKIDIIECLVWSYFRYDIAKYRMHSWLLFFWGAMQMQM
jgi:hypothetical protein